MSSSKPRIILLGGIFALLLGLVIFEPAGVSSPAHAEMAPTPTPRRSVPRAITPTYKVYLPLVSTTPLDSFTLINMDLQAGVIDVNEATT